jgi:5-methylcytosine-specific restriction endonuclease McrA
MWKSAAEKAVKTKKRKKTGSKVAEHRKKLTVGVMDLLKQWNQDLEGKEACAVCADCVPKTILQEHHFNPYNKPEGHFWLCASCHNIFNKAKLTTQQSDVERDLKLRHKRFNYNIRQM